MSNWYPQRNRTGNISNPYIADDGDAINCMITGGMPTQPYKRKIGIGGGTYNDFAPNTPSLPSHHVIFQLPPAKPIFPSGMMLTSWTENTGLPDRAFGALPTRFLLSGSNDGQTWTPIFNQSETLTIEYLVDNKFSEINDGLADPIKDYTLYLDHNDLTGGPVEDAYYKAFPETAIAYSWFKLSFDSNSPEYRIDKQYNSTTPPPYIGTVNMRISNFSVYGSTVSSAPPPITYNPPTDEKAIIDFCMAIDPFDTGVVETSTDGGVEVLQAIINPDQHLLSGRFGLFQALSIPSLNQGYIRVAKVGTDIGTLIHDTPYRLKINFAPFDNQKDLTFEDAGLVYKNNVYDDEFHYFLMEANFGVVGFGPVPSVGTDIELFFNRVLNPAYNILNFAGVDYEGGAVAHPSTNFAQTFGMTQDFNNSLVPDPFPREEIYPTPLVGIVSNPSLVWNAPYIYPIYPFKYAQVIVQENQLVITLNKNATHDLYKLYLQGGRLYVEYGIAPPSMNTLTDVVVVDDDTGRVIVSPLTNYNPNSQKTGIQFNRYDCLLDPQEVLDLAIIPDDPALPSGMPDDLIYNKVVISGENQPININEFQLFENNLNAMTDTYVKAIYDTSGRYYNSLIKDGSVNQHKVVWGTDTLTPEQLAGVVADSSVNPNTITLTETGINYHKVAGLTGKFNFYSHADVSAGGILNNLQIGTIKGWSADFTATEGAINAPFIGIYTKAKGDGSDMGSWYNSRYVLTDSAVSERITSGKLYTLDDALGIATLISSSASFTDIVFLVSIGSGSTDETEWDINVRSVDMVSDFVGGDLTVEFGHNHNLAITQDAVLTSTFNQIGMSVSFLNDTTTVFQTGLTATVGNSYDMKFSLIDANAYTGVIDADVSTDEILPFYLGWTKPSADYVDMVEIRETFALTSSSLWGTIFSPEDKVKYSVGIHQDKLELFKHILMTGAIVDNLTALAVGAGYSTAEIMYMRAGRGFGLTIRQSVEYGLDKIKPLHPKVMLLLGGQH